MHCGEKRISLILAFVCRILAVMSFFCGSIFFSPRTIHLENNLCWGFFVSLRTIHIDRISCSVYADHSLDLLAVAGEM